MPFDIYKNGLLFMKTLLSFLWMNNKWLGFDLDLMEADGKQFVKINRDGKEKRLIIIKKPKNYTACIASQATTC